MHMCDLSQLDTHVVGYSWEIWNEERLERGEDQKTKTLVRTP